MKNAYVFPGLGSQLVGMGKDLYEQKELFDKANKFMLNTIRKFCVLPKDKFYVNLEETGNTVSSAILIALKDCLDRGII